GGRVRPGFLIDQRPERKRRPDVTSPLLGRNRPAGGQRPVAPFAVEIDRGPVPRRSGRVEPGGCPDPDRRALVIDQRHPFVGGGVSGVVVIRRRFRQGFLYRLGHFHVGDPEVVFPQRHVDGVVGLAQLLVFDP